MVKTRHISSAMLLSILVGATAVQPARAHCDGIDGPVVTAARQALATGNPNSVLIWVRKVDEPQIRRLSSKR
ncbi:hypothetical protein GM672_09220 [Massilia buxea]|uniref:Uncharacterized protein n=1 Tax=Pseudoduganella buxea TaxID=1949069 RepID=A0A6I3SV32_9BURK|nr:DUF6448 family protein [Pseudoduganella buxea]MTV52909.1 hypothetical protein [Pseudoduganella buxea]GGC16464.1 hypothetical protein GCM10011572_42270 [Pseudoduganella buxea]